MGNKALRGTVLAALAAAAVLSQAAPVGAQDKVRLKIATGSGVVQAGRAERAYLKVSLTGFALPEGGARAPVNVAIVLDRSGSMSGEKIAKAKEAALLAVDRLGGDDTVALVAYNHTVSVLVPATKVSDRRQIREAISRLFADGNTALFAGVSKGAEEVRKFMDRNRVGRVILLSDGLANVGPDSPAALGDLGASLRREGISVSTIGLGSGYNEDLMSRLAMTSDGNHAFVESPRDLVRIFDAEFKDVFSVAALDIRIIIECAPGVRPLRIMNREGDIRGRTVTVNLNQVLSAQEKYVLVELEVPEGQAGRNLDVASAVVSYRDLENKSQESRPRPLTVAYTADPRGAEASVKKEVKEKVLLQQAVEANERAVRLRDEGRLEEAKKVLKDNSAQLQGAAAQMSSPVLDDYAKQNAQEAEKMDSGDWETQRKSMRESQQLNKTQRSY
jgi:Ca-activated chloride channel family protein